MTQKNRHLRTIAQLCPAISSQLKHVSTIGKTVKQQYLLQMSSRYGELWPTNGWDLLASFRHSSKFQRVSHFAFITAATSLTGGQPNFARCLAVSWAGGLYLHFSGAGWPSRWALAHILVIIITQLNRPTEGRRLSWPRHCSEDVWNVLKAVYYSGCRDKHNCPRWEWNLRSLTQQSLVTHVTTRPLRPAMNSDKRATTCVY